MLTIEDTIRVLQAILKGHGNIEVCRVGHFGEIHSMDQFNFSVCQGHTKINDIRTVLSIEPPYIGEEPD